ncbi:PucR family transcriptional regulator [Nocardia arizonensis]|uniref:PucR family transcriptional regulator n=1 Tax=Nocardia arizonensis TaxID=1141647 RepID=UPI0006CFDCF9|nr:PucR family transcriptional regulator [Nocardia arizonensis]
MAARAGGQSPLAANVAAHVHQLRTALGEPEGAARTLSSMLIDGMNPAAVARSAGIAIAEYYSVLAVAITANSPRTVPESTAAALADERRIRVEIALGTLCDNSALPLLSGTGGTVLIPEGESGDRIPRDLVAQLARAAGAPVTVTAVSATFLGIPHATDLAHELLDVVQRLRYEPALYRLGDLALEYQATRRDHITDYLHSLLDPIRPHPDLIETLRSYLDSDLNRQRTARTLNIHSNTVDYRLRRVKELTGLDPYRPNGLWYLQSALVAQTYRSSDTE